VNSSVAPRRDFALPEEDEEFLDANYPGWFTLNEGGIRWLVLPHFPVPGGYNVSEVKAAFQIPSGHPNAPLDMVYFFPPLARTSGRPIAALSQQNITGEIWQRWSRHYPWCAGTDNLTKHVERVPGWLQTELTK
jgi:Prokaryotic E2 family E